MIWKGECFGELHRNSNILWQEKEKRLNGNKGHKCGQQTRNKGHCREAEAEAERAKGREGSSTHRLTQKVNVIVAWFCSVFGPIATRTDL